MQSFDSINDLFWIAFKRSVDEKLFSWKLWSLHLFVKNTHQNNCDDIFCVLEMNFVNNYSIKIEIKKFLHFEKKKFFSLSFELISCCEHIINVFFIWFEIDNNDQKFVVLFSKTVFVISIDLWLQQIKIVFMKFSIIH